MSMMDLRKYYSIKGRDRFLYHLVEWNENCDMMLLSWDSFCNHYEVMMNQISEACASRERSRFEKFSKNFKIVLGCLCLINV